MKTFLKIFIVSLVFFIVAFFLGTQAYIKENNSNLEENINNNGLKVPNTNIQDTSEYLTLAEAFEKSPRINFLILGMEDVRSDTIILASANPQSKKVNLISIPRDTYIHRKGYDRGEQRKINSVYHDHGIEGVEEILSYILVDIPIHHYIILDYEGVKEMVDLVGGVEVDVPFHMKYSDPHAKPPLSIDIPKGKQVLDGKKALEFIRYRKGYIDGDLGRIKAQQQFLKSFGSKAASNLFSLIPKAFKYVDTDMGLLQAASYGKIFSGVKDEDISFLTLPGIDEFRKIEGKNFSYYIYDEEGIIEKLEDIYNVKKQGNL